MARECLPSLLISHLENRTAWVHLCTQWWPHHLPLLSIPFVDLRYLFRHSLAQHTWEWPRDRWVWLSPQFTVLKRWPSCWELGRVRHFQTWCRRCSRDGDKIACRWCRVTFRAYTLRCCYRGFPPSTQWLIFLTLCLLIFRLLSLLTFFITTTCLPFILKIIIFRSFPSKSFTRMSFRPPYCKCFPSQTSTLCSYLIYSSRFLRVDYILSGWWG